MSSYPWGSKAAAHLYRMWKASAGHRAMMMSTTYNYVGIGVARASNGSTWASIVFSDSSDHTGRWAATVRPRSGRTLTYAWRGVDPALQTPGGRAPLVRPPGPRGDRRGGRSATTRRHATSTLADRARGHWYGFRVQAADRRGSLGVEERSRGSGCLSGRRLRSPPSTSSATRSTATSS